MSRYGWKIIRCFVLFALTTATTNGSWAQAQVSTSNACKNGVLKVGLDIGHSRANFGTKSATGGKEYDFNRRFAQELTSLSEPDKRLKLIILSPDGRDVALRRRPRLASEKGVSVFVSIHHDSVNEKYLKTWDPNGRNQEYSDVFHGYSLFVSNSKTMNSDSIGLAKAIGTKLTEIGQTPSLHHAEPLPNERRKCLDSKLGIYEAPFTVLTASTLPSLLIEVGIIVNRDEETLLNEPAYRKTLQRLF
jgi:N-acetylmuramoyl-L-alanine amidase